MMGEKITQEVSSELRGDVALHTLYVKADVSLSDLTSHKHCIYKG
jgi:hypothetical protein